MKRRTFMGMVGGGLLAAPLAAEAQQPGKLHRLAVVYPAGSVAEMTESHDPMLRVLLSELRQFGYVEGQNLVVERRSGGGRRESYPDIAREVVALRPDVVFAGSGRMAAAFRATTTNVPIVTVTSDPVGLGLANSLARPGANVTGLTVDAGIEVIGKRLELLKEAVPNATRVGFLVPQQTWENGWGRSMREAAQRAGATSIAATVRSPIGELEYRRAFAVAAKERAQALVVTDHAESLANLRLIVELAAQGRIPAIYPFREFTEAGGLMTYSADRAEMVRRVAGYIDRVLKGANPADLPFQQPTKFELVVNLRTAKALGLTIPPSLLQRADQVID